MQAVYTTKPVVLACRRRTRRSPHNALATLVLTLVFKGILPAQNTDTLILENSRTFTVLDQISNRSEREAVLDIYRAASPRQKAEKAEIFLVQYPRSWLLVEIYEIAAKAYIDLGDFDRALRYGRASLEILPENPLLLVPLALLSPTLSTAWLLPAILWVCPVGAATTAWKFALPLVVFTVVLLLATNQRWKLRAIRTSSVA